MAIHDADDNSGLGRLLSAAKLLTNADLVSFLNELLALRAMREAPVLHNAEAELITKINCGLSSEMQERYDALIEKRLDETMSEAEQTEFMEITQRVEAMNVERMTHLVELAQIRQVTLPIVMQQLGIAQPSYVS